MSVGLNGDGCRYIHDPPHLCHWALGPQDAAAQCDAAKPGLGQSRHVLRGDSTYAYYGQVQAIPVHPVHYLPVAFEAQDGSEPVAVFGRGEPEWTAADVVRSGGGMQTDIVQCVGSTSYYILSFWQYLPGFRYRHVGEAQVYSVCSVFFCLLRPVIEYESDSRVVASHPDCLLRGTAELFVRGMLHPQLNPAAASLKCNAHRVQVGDVLRKMGDKLYLKAHFSKYIRNGEAPRMCGGRAKHSKSPYDGTDRIRFDGCNLSLRATPREAPLFSVCKYKLNSGNFRNCQACYSRYGFRGEAFGLHTAGNFYLLVLPAFFQTLFHAFFHPSAHGPYQK